MIISFHLPIQVLLERSVVKVDRLALNTIFVLAFVGEMGAYVFFLARIVILDIVATHLIVWLDKGIVVVIYTILREIASSLSMELGSRYYVVQDYSAAVFVTAIKRNSESKEIDNKYSKK